jgi:hypothetical protein
MENQYVPGKDEPSPFMDHPHAFPEAWGEWYKKTVVVPQHRAMLKEKFPGNTDHAMPIFDLRSRVTGGWSAALGVIKTTLNLADPKFLPAEPPVMFIEGTRIITSEWVMDKCMRDNITPYEAMMKGNVIKAKVGKTLEAQEVYLSNFNEWLQLDGDIRIRMVTDKERKTFSDFRVVMGYLTGTMAIYRINDKTDVINIWEVLLRILDGEAIATFTDEGIFSENDLRRLVSILQSSIGMFPYE